MPPYSTFMEIPPLPKQHAKNKSKGYIKAKRADEDDESKRDDKDGNNDSSQASKCKGDDEDGKNDSF